MPSPIQEPATESPAVTPNQNMFANNNYNNYGAARGPQSYAPNMFGDFIIGNSFQGVTTLTGGIPSISSQYSHGATSVPIASHIFKHSDNESPWPRTRVIVASNYYNNVGSQTGITREMFGFERLVGDGLSSVAVRMPIYTVASGFNSNGSGQSWSTFNGEMTTQTSVGDLVFTFKRALAYNLRTGNVLSAGVAVVAPTGPATIGGGTQLFTVDGVQHAGSIQPYASFFRSLSRTPRQGLFMQGFLASDTPFYYRDSTFVYSDLGLGYIIRRNQRSRVTAVVPMFEVHGDFAMNKQSRNVTATAALPAFTGGYTSMIGSVSYYDQVNVTGGTSFVLNNQSTLSLACGVPVSNPQPFNYELIVQFNRYFGPGVPPYLAR